MLQFTKRMERMAHLKSQISNLKSQAESCSRQLRGWADSLQNSDIRGQRHLNEHVRQTYDQQRRAEAFLEKLQQVQTGHHTGVDEQSDE